MSKRINKLKISTKAVKMSKLDILFGKRSDLNSTTTSPNTNSTKKNSDAITKPTPPNFWNDEDDEDLIFVSQLVENIDQKYTQRSSNIAKNIEIDFNRENIPCSTQIAPVSPTLFEDDCEFKINENDFFNILKDNEVNKPKCSFSIEMPVAVVVPDDFKVPKTSKHLITSVKSTNSLNNVHDAIQTHQLIERLDLLGEEIKKQNIEINDLNEKLHTKEGEVTVLRFEQNQMKEQIHVLRLKKICEADVIKKDLEDRFHEMEKNLNGKTLEINLKANEITKLKQKIVSGRTIEDFRPINHLNIRKNLEFSNNKIQKVGNPALSTDIFKRQRKSTSYFEVFFQTELETLCSVLSRIQLNNTQLEDIRIELKNTSLQSFSKALAQLSKYFKVLEHSKNVSHETINSKCFSIVNTNNVKTIWTPFNDTLPNISQPFEMYQNEKMISLRRYITAFALICQNIPKTGKELFIKTNENGEFILQKLIEFLINSKESLYYYGVLESITFLLSSLAIINSIKQHLNLLKIIIFHQPNIKIMTEISRCLLIISQSQDKETLSLLCHESEGIFLFHRKRKKIRVCRKTSCILQVYAVNLELTFQQNKALNKLEWNLLKMIAYNHFAFLRNCFEIYPHFLKNANGLNSCLCCVKLCTSVVILFHLFLSQLFENPKDKDDQIVRKICKLGLFLIFNIFDAHFPKKVLRQGGTSLKQRLYVICEWLNENLNEFGINKEYQTALKRIRSSSIFADTILNNEESLPIKKEKGVAIFNNCLKKNNFF